MWSKELENSGFKLLHSSSKCQVYMNTSTEEVFVNSIGKAYKDLYFSSGCARISCGDRGVEITPSGGDFDLRVVNGMPAIGIYQRYAKLTRME